ncbi:MAG: GGDEF domain-containing protein, partial [Ghiorsea sp.]
MSSKNDKISELLEGLDTLRPVILATKGKDKEHRSLLRRMLSLLESLQMTPSIDPSLYKQALAMLAILFDAEHGALLKRMHDAEANDASWEKFHQHVKQRKQLMDAAQQDLPSVINMVHRGCDLLGKAQPAEGTDLGQLCTTFERNIRAHLHDDAKVRNELNLLVSAMKESVSAMGTVLEGVGDDSPELQQTQKLLEKDLPSDPDQAQALLRQARQGILSAGKKLSTASQSLKQTMAKHVQQMSSLSNKLEHAEAQARNDPLTGLANRRKLTEFLSESDKEISLVFLMLDIDHFKLINDRYGHDSGDEVLESLAELLKESVRDSDMVARLGGEEFGVVLTNASVEQGMVLAEKIRKTIEIFNFNTRKHGAIDVCISVGVAERL